jgi:hypothetical protein
MSNVREMVAFSFEFYRNAVLFLGLFKSNFQKAAREAGGESS